MNWRSPAGSGHEPKERGAEARICRLEPFAPLPIRGPERLHSLPHMDLLYREASPEEVAAVARALKERRIPAHDRPLQETLEALDRLGRLWGDEDSPWRGEALEILPDLTRQSKQMVKHELDMICQLLWGANLKEWIVRELGSLEVLEGWV